MRITLILLFCCLAMTAAFSRGGAGGRTSFKAPSRPAMRAPSRPVMKAPSRPVMRTPSRPVVRAAPKPVARPAPRPVIKPAPKPVARPAPKHIVKSAPKPLVRPAPKPVVKPAPKLAPKPVMKPAPKPAPAKPVVKPAPKSAPKPVMKPAPKSVMKPAPKPVVKTAPKPVVKPAPKPVVKPAPKPVPKPVVNPAPKPAPNPVVKPVPKPIVKPVVKTPVKPAVNPPKPNVINKTPSKPSVAVAPTKVDPKHSGTIKINQNLAPNKQGQLSIDAKQNIWESKNKQHSLDATVNVNKPIGGTKGNTKTDVTLGGQYSYKTDKTQITATANGKPHQGVDLNVQANQNIWQSANQKHSLDVSADASKHLGGPLGNTKTDLTLGGQYSFNTDKTQIVAGVKGKPGQGADVSLSGQQNIWESANKRHSFDVNAEASKHLGGPLGNEKTQVNMGAQYTYQNPKTQITAGINGSPGQGAQVSIDGRQNVWQSASGNTKIDVTGGVSKQIGGPNANENPNAHVGVEINTDF
ncbi:uncharacterized protein isoform X2 [Musca autumnalis]|uniref:uncharacterized protein isoform X2 n=1 Tax=Musca autumnalis TaxID=221902 RepID=UPI003CF870D1